VGYGCELDPGYLAVELEAAEQGREAPNFLQSEHGWLMSYGNL